MKVGREHRLSTYMLMAPCKHRSEIIRSFVEILVYNCQSIASAMKDSGSIDDEKYLEVLLEHLYLYLNITERMAFGVIEHKQRNKLMTEIEQLSISLAVETTCGDWQEELKNRIYLEAMQNSFNAMQEFSRYKEFYADAPHGEKDTLIWEFCKNIARIEGKGSNVGAIVGHCYVVVVGLKNINIKSFLNKVK